MFDDTLFELVNSAKRDELEDLVCEVMTICDELKACLSEECGLGFFEAWPARAPMSSCSIIAVTSLPVWALSSSGELRTIRWFRQFVSLSLRVFRCMA